MIFDGETARTAEQSVIGAIIIEEKSLAKVIDIIIAEDFYFPELKELYKAILELSSEGKSIDFVMVLNQATAGNTCDPAETKKLLLHCVESTPSVSNAEYYAGVVVMNFNGNYMKFTKLERPYEERRSGKDWR